MHWAIEQIVEDFKRSGALALVGVVVSYLLFAPVEKVDNLGLHSWYLAAFGPENATYDEKKAIELAIICAGVLTTVIVLGGLAIVKAIRGNDGT